MDLELDRYYTPLGLAREVIEEAVANEPQAFADTSCGSGNLLLAANEIYPESRYLGSDLDLSAIAKLRKAHPSWILSNANLLNSDSFLKSNIASYRDDCDVVLLNPPFSQLGRKHVDVSYYDTQFQCSVSMAHVLKSLEYFQPAQCALLFAPESLLFSETDEAARLHLKNYYSFETLAELESSTFSGARVHTAIVKITPRIVRRASSRDTDSTVVGLPPKIPLEVIRGCLPVFQKGTPSLGKGNKFIHSTDLKLLSASSQNLTQLPKTEITRQGFVSDSYVLLIPRVGVPNRNNLPILELDQPIQLSDCVIAIKSNSLANINTTKKAIIDNWSEFFGLYRGTAARYITISKLNSFLTRHHL